MTFEIGSVHPPRGTPPMWDSILEIAKDNGLNMVCICLNRSSHVYIMLFFSDLLFLFFI